MKKKRIIVCVIILALVAAAGGYLVLAKKQREEQNAIKAMYLTYGQDSYIFADIRGGLFTAPIPEDALYDMEGGRITRDDLKPGNILKIYGNGMMLESYPGQYPGVTRMQVCELGSKEDADAYEEELAFLIEESDPSDPPNMDIEYRQANAVVIVYITRGGYRWSYETQNGETEEITTDVDFILNWSEISDLTLSEPADLLLHFSEMPSEVSAKRWTIEEMESYQAGDPIPEGEMAAVAHTNDGWTIQQAEAGYVYQISGTWDNGYVEYGFLTKS